MNALTLAACGSTWLARLDAFRAAHPEFVDGFPFVFEPKQDAEPDHVFSARAGSAVWDWLVQVSATAPMHAQILCSEVVLSDEERAANILR